LFEEGLTFAWRELVVRRSRLSAYHLRETGQTVYLRHRTPDLGGLTEIYVQRNYEPPEAVRDVLAEIPQPLAALDLGANIGLFGLYLLMQRPDAHITAVEPDPFNADVLRRTIRANDKEGTWKIVQACASSRTGTVPFRSGHHLESRVAPDGVPTRAVDALPLMRRADYIKLDIEGGELELLQDPRFPDTSARIIALEYHPPHPRARISRLLQRAGYTIEAYPERLPGVGEVWAWK
jgi:FkbM family methyltransferase